MNLDRARSHLKSIESGALASLEGLVRTNSFTRNREGVNAVVDRTSELFTPLGFEAERVRSEVPEYGDHLILTRPGKSKQRIVMVSHLDTVFTMEEEQENDFAWRVDGPRIYGPGTNDIKGGTVLISMILSAFREADPALYDQVNWSVLMNASEETGCNDFPRIAREHASDGAVACLVYECGYPAEGGGTLVVSRKGSARMTMKVRGRAAHSGSRHERGANAIVELADKILKIAGLTDYGRGLTTNVGVVAGGIVANSVPDYAEAKIDVRALDLETFEETNRQIRDIASQVVVKAESDGFACSVELVEHPFYPPLPRNEKTDGLFELAQGIGRELGHELEPQVRGGASDACHLWQIAPTIDGLGPVGDNSHCAKRSDDGTREQEYVLKESFVPRALLSLKLINRLLGG